MANYTTGSQRRNARYDKIWETHERLTTQRQKKISKEFISELGKFVKKQKSKAEKQGMAKKEFQAIVSTSFNLLGKNAEHFRKEAGMK